MEGKSQGRTISIVLLSLFSLLFFCSCRFKSPSQSEGQALYEAGVFPSGLPAWVKTPEGEDAARASNAGLIPRSFGVPESVRSARALAPEGRASLRDQQADPRDEELGDERAGARRGFRTGQDADAEEEEVSPLDRIERVCPGMEDGVKDALGTVDAEARIRKYSDLTRRCPSSADIWLWLGKDYKSVGRNQEAVRAFERVLVIDRDNEAAKALLRDAENPVIEDPIVE